MPRRYLLFVLTGEVSDAIQSMRIEWDPVMAERIPPHLTLVYPEEVPYEDLLLARTAEAASQTPSFDVSPGDLEESNLGGVWLRIVDPTGSWSGLRDLVLRPPFSPYPVIPHVTVVHPRTSRRGADAMSIIDGVRIAGRCRIDEILYTETGRKGTRVLERFGLEGRRE